MRHLIQAFALAAALSLTAGCGTTSVTEVAGPTGADRCQSSMTGVPSFSAAGGSSQATVTAPRECQWTAATQASWLRVAPASGQGDAILTVTAEANPDATQRSGAVALNGQAFMVTQTGADCRYAVTPLEIQLGADAGRRSVQITAPGGCAWTSRSPVDWIEAATPSGSGSGVANFDVDENTGGARKANLQVAGLIVTVLQSGGTPTGEDPASSPAPSPPAAAPAPAPSEPTPQPDPPAASDPCPPKGGGKDCKAH